MKIKILKPSDLFFQRLSVSFLAFGILFLSTPPINSYEINQSQLEEISLEELKELLPSIEEERRLRQSTEVIYGEDNRYNVSEYHDREFREYAKSVAGMVHNIRLIPMDTNGERFEFPRVTYQQNSNVCPDVNFADQYTLPRCTGFLVGPDLLLTAGHCLRTERDCRTRFKWAFELTEELEYIKSENIYGCSEILEREHIETESIVLDYALIKLDGKVTNREPLRINMSQNLTIHTPLVMIGHPSHLPLKIADQALVRGFNKEEIERLFSIFKETDASRLFQLFSLRTKKSYYFNADLDAFRGNSGSPVFNQNTGKVEGILIQGATDYEIDEELNCRRPNVKKNSSYDSEEMVFRINRVKNLLQHIEESYQRHY